jgi:putative endonuclease
MCDPSRHSIDPHAEPPSVVADQRQFGRDSESLAVRHLKKRGYKIVQRNFRTRLGEIDIIARHRGVMVFVEVKARRSDRYGDPRWALTPAKRRKISMVALEYLKKHGTTQTKARFDVVTVQAKTDPPRIEVIPNAFELNYPS